MTSGPFELAYASFLVSFWFSLGFGVGWKIRPLHFFVRGVFIIFVYGNFLPFLEMRSMKARQAERTRERGEWKAFYIQ